MSICVYSYIRILGACLRLITRSRSGPLAWSCFAFEDTAGPTHGTTCHTLGTKFPVVWLQLNIVTLKLFYTPNYTAGNSLTWVFKLESLDFKGFVSPDIVTGLARP